MQVAIYSSFTDSGAVATDSLGNILPIQTSTLSSNFTSSVGSYSLSYSATDAAGRNTVVARTVKVIDPCSPAEKTCNVNGTCSFNGYCGGLTSSLSSLLTPFSSAPPTASSSTQAPQVDTSIPAITLLGVGTPWVTSDGSTGLDASVVVGSAYIDPGATAIKVPTIPSLPSADLTTSIVVSGLSALSTRMPTSADSPYVISYDVKDKAGNAAATVRRRVHVLCPSPEITCTSDDGGLYCSSNGICGLGISILSSSQAAVSQGQISASSASNAGSSSSSGVSSLSVSSSTAASSSSQTSQSTQSAQSVQTVLSLVLNGPSSVSIYRGAPYVPCSGAKTVGCELGATASLNSAGDYNYAIVACAERSQDQVPVPYALTGLAYCNIDTSKPGTYTITFSISDVGGSIPTTAVSSVKRTLTVLTECDPGEKLCDDGFCAAICVSGQSTAGSPSTLTSSTLQATTGNTPSTPFSASTSAPSSLSISTSSSAPAQLPTLAFSSDASITLKQGTDYLLCIGASSAANGPCETGPVVTPTPDDPNVADRILMCPPDDCYQSGCLGHLLTQKQPSSCGVISTAEVGTVFKLTFVVYSLSGARVTLTRIITIVGPCDAGQYYCSGKCQSVDCATSSSIQTLSTSGPQTKSPTLTPVILLLPFNTSLSSSSLSDLSSSPSQTIYLPYGQPAPYSLVPCPSFNTNSTVSCAAAAFDPLTKQDLSPFILTIDVSAASNPVQCSLASITMGHCLPGMYTYQYSVTSDNGTYASTALTVYIEELSTLAVDYYFVPHGVDNSSQPAVLAFAAELKSNTSLALNVVSQHLPTFGIDPASLRSLSVNQTTVLMLIFNPITYMIHIQLSITLGNIPDLNTLSLTESTGARRRRLLDTVAGRCISSSVITVGGGPSAIIVNSSLPAIINTTCATSPITANVLVLNQVITFLVNATLSTYDTASYYQNASTFIKSLGDTFDAKDSEYFQSASDFFDRASTDQSVLQAGLETEISSLLLLQSYSSIISSSTLSAIQEIYATVNTTASLMPASVSPISVLAAYGIILGDDSLSDAAVEFANCVFNASSDPVYPFSIDSFTAISNSSTGSRRLLAAKGGGSTGSGKSGRTASVATLGGYSIDTGLSEISYDLYNLSNPNPTRRIGSTLGNMVLGGLFLHTVRKSSSPCSRQTRFSSLIASSACPTFNKSGAMGGIGNDPVFNPSSSIYISILNPEDFYNMTLGSGEFDPASDIPYGFFPSTLPGRPTGYPVLLSSYVSGRRAKEELAYMLEGGLLDKQLTDSLNIRLLVFNPMAYVFGMFSATFTWSSAGLIEMKGSFFGLPALTYTTDPSAWRLNQMVPDIVLMSLISSYMALSIYSLTSDWSIESERRRLGTVELDSDDIVTKKQEKKKVKEEEKRKKKKISDEEIVWSGHAKEEWKTRAKIFYHKKFRSKVSFGLIVFEVLHCFFMLGAVVCWFLYAVLVMQQQAYSTRFDMYDSDASAPARYFLPYRDASKSGLNASAIPAPGSKGRWELPGDESGLEALNAMLNRQDQLDYIYEWYAVLQGFVLLLFVLKFIHLISFQPRLGAIAGGLVSMLPDLIHLFAIAFICGMMIAMLWVVVYGYRVEEASTFGNAVVNFGYLIFTNIDFAYPSATVPGLVTHPLESVIIRTVHVLSTFLFVWTLKAFIVTVIMTPYALIVYEARESRSVPEDLSNLFKWFYDSRLRRYDNNHAFLKVLRRVQRAPPSGIGFFNMLYSSRALRKVKTTEPVRPVEALKIAPQPSPATVHQPRRSSLDSRSSLAAPLDLSAVRLRTFRSNQISPHISAQPSASGSMFDYKPPPLAALVMENLVARMGEDQLGPLMSQLDMRRMRKYSSLAKSASLRSPAPTSTVTMASDDRLHDASDLQLQALQPDAASEPLYTQMRSESRLKNLPSLRNTYAHVPMLRPSSSMAAPRTFRQSHSGTVEEFGGLTSTLMEMRSHRDLRPMPSKASLREEEEPSIDDEVQGEASRALTLPGENSDSILVLDGESLSVSRQQRRAKEEAARATRWIQETTRDLEIMLKQQNAISLALVSQRRINMEMVEIIMSQHQVRLRRFKATALPSASDALAATSSRRVLDKLRECLQEFVDASARQNTPYNARLLKARPPGLPKLYSGTPCFNMKPVAEETESVGEEDIQSLLVEVQGLLKNYKKRHPSANSPNHTLNIKN